MNYLLKKWKWLVGLLVPVAFAATFLGATPTEQSILTRIENSQNAYYSTNGKYWQGLEDWNKAPHYQAKSMSGLVDVSDLNPNTPRIRVDQYHSLKGDGYQVIMTYPDRIKSFGYGVESAERTFERIISQGIATTTP